MTSLRRELLFSLIIALLCLILFALDITRVPPAPSGIRGRGLITAVDNSKVRTNLIVKTNAQYLTVRLLSGPHQGQELQVVNMLTGKMELDEFYETGKVILVEYSAPEGKPINAVARGYHRLGLQLFLAGLFGLLLFGVAGVTGLLGFRWPRLREGERAGLVAITLLGLLSHMSCMALGIGLIVVLFMLRMIAGRWGWSLPVFIPAPAAVVVVSLVLMPLLHLTLVGKGVYTPGGPNFIFGRLVQDGIAQRWLAEHCPAPGIKLCGLQDRIPATADDFLWNESSPFRDIGGWDGPADAELSFLVRACAKAYPGPLFWTSLRATLQQMVLVATGDGFDEIQNDTRAIFSVLLPRTAEEFNRARQQQNRITRELFDRLNRVHVPVARFSVFGLLAVAGWGIRARRHDRAGIALFIFLALLGNGFICGALSNPHNRYQSRLVWLAPLVVGMAMVSAFQQASSRKSS